MDEIFATTVTAAMVAMLALEGIKFIIRRVKKNPEYEYPMKFYYFMLPVTSFLAQPFMALIGFPEYSLPTDWVGWIQELLRVGVTTAIQVLLYEGSLAKLKEAKIKKESVG